MPTNLLSLAALLSVIVISPSLAAGDDKPNAERRQRILEEFDLDGDGKLNEDERAAAREARGAQAGDRRQAMLDKFDADGDGKLNEQEHAAARAERGNRRGPAGPGGRRGAGRGSAGGPMQAMLANPDQAFKSLDTDGDGALSRSEFQVMVQQMQQARERMRAQAGQRRGPRGEGRPNRRPPAGERAS